LCTKGHECNKPKLTEPAKCKAGTYADTMGLSECKPCVEGYACFDEAMITYLVNDPEMEYPYNQ
jgi:hypothetical protein